VYALIPLAVIVLNKIWEWFRTNVLGQSQNDDHLFENVRSLCGYRTCAVGLQSPLTYIPTRL
jgi:hypothetical protein